MSAVYKLLLTLVLGCASLSAFAGVGFDDRFSARSGDLNGDGRTDLFVKWTPKVVMIELDDLSIPIPTSRRDVPDFVLQQASDGTFSILGSLTSTQLSTVSSWPLVSAAVELVAADANFDGKVDLIIRNLVAAIAGADNQIITAAITPGAAPVAVRSLNATMRNFYREVGNWFLAPEIVEVISYLEWFYAGYSSYYDPFFCAGFVACDFFVDDVDDPQGTWPGDDPFTPNVYHYWGAYLVSYTVTYRDYELTDPTALQFADVFYDMEPAGAIQMPSPGADILQQILGQIWGQPTVVLDQVPPEGVEPEVKPNWRWYSIAKHLLKVWSEVCIQEGDTARDCWLNMAAPGFPGLSICQTRGPFDSGGPFFNYAITPTQRTLSQTDQRRPFWVSRYQDSCDPFAPAALGVVDERGLGLVTMKWLRSIANHKGIQFDETQLGYEIMHAHVSTTDTDTFGILHLLSKQQITDYHQDVFDAHGFPDYTFGGAPFGDDTWGGRRWMDFLGMAFWCPDCDKVP